MKIVPIDQVPNEPVAMAGAKDVCRQLVLSQADGCPTFSFRVFTIAPGGHTPYHTHACEHLNYVISGAGCLVEEGGEEHELGEGDFALVLPEEKHQYRNVSADEPFRMICAVPKEYE